MGQNDLDFEATLQAAIDGKTKPLGSLGRIEELAAQLARVQKTLRPQAERCRLTIFAADHGIAEEGVSAFPQAVTREMVKNFLAGGAAANIFAKVNGVELVVVDAGVAGMFLDEAGLIQARIGAGTANSVKGPAMSAKDAERAIEAGRTFGVAGEVDAVAFGEMGIGNTSSASLLAAKLTGQKVADYIGRGTGLDDAGIEHKKRILEQAAARTQAKLTPEEALREYGGFEIAMMTGAMISAAQEGRLVLVDGFIASSAAAAALGIAPDIRKALVFTHLSHESGHARLLNAIDAEPLLSLGLRLGEGTGALLAWPLVRAAAAMLTDMASFESAGVSRE